MKHGKLFNWVLRFSDLYIHAVHNLSILLSISIAKEPGAILLNDFMR